jgi:hypothetical protein
LTSFEKLRQNALLLLINVMATLVSCLDAQTFALNRVVELALSLRCLVLG